MEPDHTNSQYCNALRKLWAEPACVALLAKIKGSLGSHRNRKVPATWCAENNCTDADVEVMGKWKGGKNDMVLNRYISVEQLTTDDKLTNVLDVSVPFRYMLNDKNHVSLQFLKITVAPKMHKNFGAEPINCIAYVLTLPLLWTCHEPSLVHMIHPQVLSRVHQGYISIHGQHGVTYNPVYKPPLHISRVENLVFIEDAVAMGKCEGDANWSQAATAAAQSSQIQTLLLSINLLGKRQAENQQQLQQNMSDLCRYTATHCKQVHTNMNQFASSPATRASKARGERRLCFSHTQQHLRLNRQALLLPKEPLTPLARVFIWDEGKQSHQQLHVGRARPRQVHFFR
jgi:hypothetical protein